MSLINNWQPFYELNDFEFSYYIETNLGITENYSIDRLNEVVFNQFNLTYNEYDCNLNPDLNFFLHNETNINCQYHFNDTFQNSIVEPNNNHMFSMLSININSIPRNLNYFITTCLDTIDFKFDILSFCETKLNDDIEQLYIIENYNKFTNNTSRKSGGIALFIKNIYSDILERSDLRRSSNFLESLFVEIKDNKLCNINSSILVGSLYRRPNSNLNDFLDELEIIINLVNIENKKLYLLGDFNINLFNYDSDAQVRRFVNLMHSNNMFNVINKSTRVTSTSATLIDHIWTNNLVNLQSSGIIFDKTSDHFPIFSCFKIGSKKFKSDKSESFEIKYRNFSDINIINFRSELQKVDWSLVYSNYSNSSYENFLLIFKNLYNKHFPILTRKVKLNNKPYITNEIKRLIREKNKLQKLSAKWPLSYGQSYRSIRNKVTESISIAKSQYFKKRLLNSAGDPKNTWKVINEVMNRNRTKQSHTINNNTNVISNIADSFNLHFSSVGSSLANKIIDNNVDPLNYLGERSMNICELPLTNEQEIVEIVAGMSDAAAGCDEIPMSIVKKVIHEIKTPLNHICNTAFVSGIFPEKMKIAKIIPLFKQGDTKDLNNYRPISLLPAFSKILEKLIYNRLNDFFTYNNILTDAQYGFRKHRSTVNAVIQLYDHVLKSFDRNNYTAGVFLDFKKAFDCVDHAILIKKLEHYGLRGITLKLISNYLHNRQQFTFYLNTYSSKTALTHSVPQGSILGPLLFNIYINDIFRASDKLKIILFADDSCLYYSNSNIYDLIHVINRELNFVDTWLKTNRLTLNLNKSHYIIFSRRLTIPHNTQPLQINNNIIKKESETKFLGIIIQDNMKWDRHIQELTNKISKYSSIIYQIRNNLDKHSLKLIYYSLIYSNLIYMNIIWGRSPQQHLRQLEISQKKTIRTIKFRSRYYHTNDDFYSLGFLKLKEINIYCGSIFTFKSLNNLTFPANYFSYVGNTNYPLRNTLDLRTPLVHSTQSQSSPSFYCCSIWNNLPPNIKNRPSAASFRLVMKKHLLSTYLTNN